MLAPIQFHYQFCFQAEKIYNIAVNNSLPVPSWGSSTQKAIPQPRLRRCWLVAQLCGMRSLTFVPGQKSHSAPSSPVPAARARLLLKGAVSQRLTEDCVLRSKTYEVNKDCKTVFASHILASPKCNPPPQFANWGTSFQKEACPCGGDQVRENSAIASIKSPSSSSKPYCRVNWLKKAHRVRTCSGVLGRKMGWSHRSVMSSSTSANCSG